MKIVSFRMKLKWMQCLREVRLKISRRSPLSTEMNDASTWRIGVPVVQFVMTLFATTARDKWVHSGLIRSTVHSIWELFVERPKWHSDWGRSVLLALVCRNTVVDCHLHLVCRCLSIYRFAVVMCLNKATKLIVQLYKQPLWQDQSSYQQWPHWLEWCLASSFKHHVICVRNCIHLDSIVLFVIAPVIIACAVGSLYHPQHICSESPVNHSPRCLWYRKLCGTNTQHLLHPAICCEDPTASNLLHNGRGINFTSLTLARRKAALNTIIDTVMVNNAIKRELKNSIDTENVGPIVLGLTSSAWIKMLWTKVFWLWGAPLM